MQKLNEGDILTIKIINGETFYDHQIKQPVEDKDPEDEVPDDKPKDDPIDLPTKGKIVFFGTSYEWGAGSDSPPHNAYTVNEAQRYSTILSKALGLTEINKGENGIRISPKHNFHWTAARSGETMTADHALAIVSFGINDAFDNIPADEFISAYKKEVLELINTYKWDKSKLILLTPFPSFMPEVQGLISQYKTKIEALGKELSIKVIDVTTPLRHGTRINEGDSVHVNVSGHKLIADTIYKAIKGEETAEIPQETASEVIIKGLNNATAKGSINAGSKVLNLSKSINVKEGDYIVVSTGGESGKGLMGSLGVGGGFPYVRYNSKSEMEADKSQVSGKYASAAGEVFRYDGNGSWVKFTNRHYYASWLTPFALRTKVLGVSNDGKQLTLEDAAEASTTNADVYFDNSVVLESYLNNPSYKKVVMPDNGTYYIGDDVDLNRGTGIHFDQKQALIISAKGATSAYLRLNNSPNTIIENVVYQGNVSDDGLHGAAFPKDFYPKGGEFMENPYELLGGVQFFSTQNTIGRNIKVINAISYSLQFGSSIDTYFEDCEVIAPGSRGYAGWQIHAYTSWSSQPGIKKAGFYRIKASGPTIFNGYEAFGCRDLEFTDIEGVNTINAMNGSGRINVTRGTFTIKHNSCPDWINLGAPVFEINKLFNSGDTASGINFKDIKIIQEGFQKGSYLLSDIYGRDNTPNVTINGFESIRPDAIEGTGAVLSVFVWADGARIENVKVKGKFPPSFYKQPGEAGYENPYAYRANISVNYGAVTGKGLGKGYVKNCVADFIVVKEGIELSNNVGNITILKAN